MRMSMVCAALLVAGAGTVAGAQARTGAATQQPDNSQRYTKTTAMVAMRDGVRLNTDVYVPRDRTGPLPVIFLRTPYGIANRARTLNTSFRELADDGYIFVFQDIRGRYRSEGQFVMQRPVRTAAQRNDPRAIDEATDAYDTIEWIVTHVPGNTGRVGMLGVSYDGWTTAMALTDPHPALRAASPQASPADMWLGDDFHHNGAFRLSYGFEYAAMMETGKESEKFEFPTYDTYEWYLALGSLANVNAKVLEGKIPTWNDYVAHPDYDQFWQRQTLLPALTQVTVPTLNVAGWWDQEDFYGPVAIYERLERFDRDNKNFLVVGPWNHGGWNAREGRMLGNIDFGSPTAKYFRDSVQARFFARYLKDRGAPPQPEALVFEGGANAWRSYDAWPPTKDVSPRSLYFRENGALSFEAPPASACTGTAAATRCTDTYVSDPAHPVPYRARPIQATYDPRGSGWYTWLTEDQRFVDNRPDVLTWRTEPLTQDVTIAGDVIAHLFAATSGSDADWIVKLIDVYPQDIRDNPRMGGYELMVSNEVFRGRYRKSFEHPSPLVPNEPAEFSYSLHGQSYRFQRGHRIMVQVQSTWFPIIDRNPQTYVPNIFQARPTDFRTATVTVYRTPVMASHLTLPVIGPRVVP